MGSAGQGSPGLAHVVQSEGTGAGCATWLLHTCLAPLGRSGFLTRGGFGLVPLLTRGLASPERVFQETQAEVKGFLRPSFRSHMASFLTPNSIGQSESQAPCRFLGRGEGLHLALGGTAIFPPAHQYTGGPSCSLVHSADMEWTPAVGQAQL